MKPIDVDKETSRAHLEAKGWQLQSFQQNNPILSHMVYIVDYRHQQIALASLVFADFESFSSRIPMSVEEAASAIANHYDKQARRKLKKKHKANLGGILVSYIGNTRTYQQWRNQVEPGDRFHCLINIFGRKGHLGTVRPAMLTNDGTVKDIEVVMASSQSMMTHDKTKNPQWFD